MSLYNTEPPELSYSTQKKSSQMLSLSNDRKYSKSYHKKNSIQQNRIFTETIQLSGNPENQYLIRKISGFAKNIQYLAKKRMRTEQKLPSLSHLRPSIMYPLQSSKHSSINSNDSQTMMQRAFVLNQSQKIQRLINKREQQQQRFKTLSHRLKIKLIPHKPKVPKYQSYVQPMQKYTWYRKWSKNQSNQKCRKKWKILDKMKSHQMKRNNLTQVYAKQQVQP